jgi:small-conductance mechanosensitive channel
MITGLLIFMVFLALILAMWEIQIEGKDGWAAKSPGGRIET